MSDTSRRQFLTRTAALAAATSIVTGCVQSGTERLATHAVATGPLTSKPMGRVRFGLIGVGSRGGSHVRLLCLNDAVDIVAIADPHQPAADDAAKLCNESDRPAPTLYTDDEHGYRKLLERDDIDAVLISTPWRWHRPQGVEAMRAGKHAFIEVPMAISIEGLWELVETSEKTGKHCMMLENVNYGRDELMTLNMVRQNLFGDLLHGEAAYIHDLRSQMQDVGWGTGSWRTAYHTEPQGNLYPTHGLGPVAQYMNIDRGADRFEHITSMSSPAMGRNLYAKEQLADDNPHKAWTYRAGDMNTSIIKTAMGRTIMVQYDTTSPRPYTRHNLIQGTRGCLAGYPTRVVAESLGNTHDWIEGDALEEIRQKYEHPLWTRMGKEAEAAGGHGGMDYIMLRRVIENLQQGTPMDQNVYEGASWSAVRPLSTASVKQGGAPIAFPDFSRGLFKSLPQLEIVS